MRRKIDLLLTDLDGTLYDWLGFYIPSFLAEVRVLSEISGVPAERLKESFKRVNRAHGTSEYAFAIQELDELPEVRSGTPAEAILRKYDPAIHAFRSERRRRLRLFDGVQETLKKLRNGGVKLVAHSDSMMSYVSRRLRQLDVDHYFDAICAPKDHGLPMDTPEHLVRVAPRDEILSRVRELPYLPALRKPDPGTLEPVFDAFSIPNGRIAYVGDSLSRDMVLADRCHLRPIWAKYRRQHAELVAELLKITYWTPEDVAAEDQLLRDASRLSIDQIDSFRAVLALCGVE